MKKLEYGIHNDYGLALSALNGYKIHWQNVLEAYNKFQLRPIKNEDLSSIFSGKNFIKDVKLEGEENTKIGNIKLSQEQLRNFIELPHHEVLQFEKTLTELKIFNEQNRALQIRLSDFKVVNDEIVFPNYERVLKERYTLYAETPRQEKAVKVLREICERLNENSLIVQDLFKDERFIMFRNDKYLINQEGIRWI